MTIDLQTIHDYAERANEMGDGHQYALGEILAMCRAALAAPAQQPLSVNDILAEFDRRGAPGTGFYDPHEPAEIIRDMLRARGQSAAPSQQPEPLTDEEIRDEARRAIHAGELSWLGFEKDSEGRYTVPVLSPSDYKLVRIAIAADRAQRFTSPSVADPNSEADIERLLARVLELEAVHEDASGAVLQERERCAKLCEQTDDDGEGPDCWGWHSKDYARAIRGA